MLQSLHRFPAVHFPWGGSEFGKPTSLWTLALAAEVCHAKGWTARRLTAEGMRGVLARLGIGWKRAKHWITSPDPEDAKKTSCGTG